jgi:hypothetical protein
VTATVSYNAAPGCTGRLPMNGCGEMAYLPETWRMCDTGCFPSSE